MALNPYITKVHWSKMNNEWVKNIRIAMGMNLSQLAIRMNITRQSLAKLEANEAAGTITIRSLRKLAHALECKFVYEFMHNE